jgi:hypothetical protein
MKMMTWRMTMTTHDHVTDKPSVIAVDFDGTLAEYHGWTGDHTILGKPIPKMMDRVKAWLKEGKEVWIFTARVDGAGQASEISIKQIEDWLMEHLGQKLPITNQKRWFMKEWWDDRAIQVTANTGETVEEQRVIAEEDIRNLSRKIEILEHENSLLERLNAGLHNELANTDGYKNSIDELNTELNKLKDINKALENDFKEAIEDLDRLETENEVLGMKNEILEDKIDKLSEALNHRDD